MKSAFSFICLFFALTAFADPGQLVRTEHIFDQSGGSAILKRARLCPDASKIKKDYGFKAYRLTFKTTDVSGREVDSQGLMLIPHQQGPLPLIVVQHGTVFGRSELPSNYSATTQYGDALRAANCYTAVGYIAVMPDYIGFGDGTGVHPYLHADSEARVARDMMRAAQASLAQMQTEWNRKLFITGYSQGGHAAMALLKFLETDPQKEFQVTAGAPMAGPYDLMATIPLVLNQPTKHSGPELAFILAGLNPIYGFYQDASEAVQPQFVSAMTAMFDGSKNWLDALISFPVTPRELLSPEFLHKSLNDPNSAFLKAMRENENYNWVPTSPIHLYHGEADHEVPFINSQNAYQYFKDHGANVELINLGKDVDHMKGTPLAVGQAITWFETF